MKIEPVAQSTLVDRVVERIRQVIDQEKLQSGDRLPAEMELADQLQVSRSVVREAVSRLEIMGLLKVRRGLGMFVGDRDSLSSCVNLVRSALAIAPKELQQLAEFRRAIECHSARRAAERATPEELVELEALGEQIDRNDQDDVEAIRADFRFHRQLVAMTGNELMLNVMGVIQEFVMAGMVHTTPSPRNRDASRRGHRAILDAIHSRDPDRAEAAMRAHMDAVAVRLQKAEEIHKQRRKREAVGG